MSASINDKITDSFNSANPNVARVTGTRSALGTTLACDNLAGWPTGSGVHFSTYQIDTNNDVVPGTQIDWKGIVSGNSIGTLTRKAGATDTGSSIGDVVEANPTGSWGHDLFTGLTQEHNQLDGTHKAITATSVVTTGSVTAGNGLTVSSGTVSLPSASISQTALPLSTVVQTVNSVSSAVATGTTTIPLDDTIPQITEGDQYMTLAITPKATTNILVIDATLSLANSAVVHLIAALFQDSTANALAAINQFQETAGGNRIVRVMHAMAAGTTSATTFKIRAGGSGAGTTTFNGAAGTRLFGAITKSSIVITEYKA